ncbi:MAG TPA: disulfide bond formation protein B [Gammaproteobacteria bacterium]|nr:disulfide bond formation protein B [Gammaproteobacteria bacterium]
MSGWSARFARAGWAGPGLILLALVMEATALYYQYRLEYWPCVLCIHVRVWLLGLMAAGLLVWLTRRRGYALGAAWLLVGVVGAGLLDRSGRLLGTERGWIEGSCAMESGLPDWFALDRWFPGLFQVMEPCGYTPELLFGITMAEALVAFSVLLILLALAGLKGSFVRPA